MKITKRFFSIFMCLILIICITGVFPEKPSAAAETVKATGVQENISADAGVR